MGKEGEQQFRGNFIQRQIKKLLQRADLNYEVIGVENLTGVNRVTGEEKAYNLKALLDQGETATALPNHPAYADFPTGAAIVAKEGLEEFMGTLVISKKYTNSPLIGPPIRVMAFGLGLRLESVNPHKYGGDKKNQKMNSKAQNRVKKNKVYRKESYKHFRNSVWIQFFWDDNGISHEGSNDICCFIARRFFRDNRSWRPIFRV